MKGFVTFYSKNRQWVEIPMFFSLWHRQVFTQCSVGFLAKQCLPLRRVEVLHHVRAGGWEDVCFPDVLNVVNVPELDNFRRGGNQHFSVSRKRDTMDDVDVGDAGDLLAGGCVDQIRVRRGADSQQVPSRVECQG